MATTLTSAELDLTRYPTTPVGGPYIVGDVVAVEHEDSWQDATILAIEPLPKARFGLRWVLTVRLSNPTGLRFPTEPQVYVCDDNGRNHTWRQQVCPSFTSLES